MCNFKLLLSVIFLCGIVAVLAQPPCVPRLYNVQAGQRICERQCFSGPGTGITRCATARVPTTVRLCPPNCCRQGSRCLWTYRT